MTVRTLTADRGDAAFAVCRYDDGRGHPFAFGRAAFVGGHLLVGHRLLAREGGGTLERRRAAEVPDALQIGLPVRRP